MIEIPGGREALSRVIGAPIRQEPSEFLRSLNRVLLAEWDSKHEWKDVGRRRALVHYLDDLDALKKKFPGAISIGLESRDQRRSLSVLAGHLGYKARFPKGGVEIEPREGVAAERLRRLAHGLNWDLVAIAERLKASGRIELAITSDHVPAASLADWGAIRGKPVDDPLRVLATDQRLGLALEGRERLSRDTLAGFAGLDWSSIYRRDATAFHRYAPAIRIAADRLVTPGGEASEPIWTELVGTSPRNPGAFVAQLLGRKGARSAYLWHALAFLPESTAAFYLGVGEADSGSERNFARRLSRRLDETVATDFDRAKGGDLGFGTFARSMPLTASGEALDLVGGPGLWFVAGKGTRLPSNMQTLARLVRRGRTETLTEGEFLLKTLTEEVKFGGYSRPILPRLLRAANMFPGRPDLLTPANAILIVRASDQAPTALRVLDVVDELRPDTVREYLLTVGHLHDLKAGVGTELLIAGFQGGAEWIRHMALAGKVSDERLDRALATWSRIHYGMTDPHAVAPRQHEWIVELLADLLEAPPSTPGRGPMERAFLWSLIGPGKNQQFRWQGLDYQRTRGHDLAATMAQRLVTQAIPSADLIAAIDRAFDRLLESCLAADLEAARDAHSDLTALIESLPPVEMEETPGFKKLLPRIAPVDRNRMLDRLRGIARVRQAGRLTDKTKDVRAARKLMARELRPFLLAPSYLGALAGEKTIVLDDPHLVRKHLLFSSLANEVAVDKPWIFAKVRGGEETGLGAYVLGPVGGVSSALAEFSQSAGAGASLFRNRIWYADLRATRWHEFSSGLTRLVAALVDGGQALYDLALGEAVAGGGPTADFVARRVPYWRLEAEAEGDSARVSPSEHLMLGLAAFAGDGQGNGDPGLPAGNRAAIEKATEVLGKAWRQELHQIGAATPWLNGRLRPWVGTWPPYEAVEFERQPYALSEREVLDLKVAILAYLGRQRLPGYLGEDLFPEVLLDATTDLRLEHLYDWESHVRWFASLDDDYFSDKLRKCLAAGFYRVHGF